MSIPNEQNESFSGMASFFSDLSDALNKSQDEFQRSLDSFFVRLKPNLDASKHIDHELNRELAHHFNFMDYLRDDELGISRIIADLLNPHAKHGQGIMFLRLLLHQLKFEEPWLKADLDRATVTTEETIERNRRIDICVHIPSKAGEFCIAIENKPFTGDQLDQVQDYISHLRRNFKNSRRRLIFLSGDGRPPSNESLKRSELEVMPDNSEFLILAYSRSHFDVTLENDEFKRFRASTTLVEWLAKCHQVCHADKLRVFLRDVETYCKDRFGEQHVISDRETETISEYLVTNPANLGVAIAVYEAWPRVKDSICTNFIDLIRRELEKLIRKSVESPESLIIGCQYSGEVAFANKIWVYSKEWQIRSESAAPETGGKVAIMLENQSRGPTDWIVGVRCPTADAHEANLIESREALVKNLAVELGSGRTSKWWAWWQWVDAEFKDWNRCIVEIGQELADEEHDEISNYFASKLAKVVMDSVSVLNDIERSL